MISGGDFSRSNEEEKMAGAYKTGNTLPMSYVMDTAYNRDLTKSYTDRIVQSRERQTNTTTTIPYDP
jgi:hypothetical protein